MKIVANNYRANEVFKMIRENSGKTQTEFGKIVGKSRNAIQYYEYGQRNFDFELLLEIAKKENLIITIESKRQFTNSIIYVKMLTKERDGVMVGFGENLKRIRLLKGLSLREAAKLLGMSHVAVSKYEKGLIVPNSQTIILFANAYHVKVIELLQTYEVPRMKFTSFRKKSRL